MRSYIHWNVIVTKTHVQCGAKPSWKQNSNKNSCAVWARPSWLSREWWKVMWTIISMWCTHCYADLAWCRGLIPVFRIIFPTNALVVCLSLVLVPFLSSLSVSCRRWRYTTTWKAMLWFRYPVNHKSVASVVPTLLGYCNNALKMGWSCAIMWHNTCCHRWVQYFT